MKQVRIGLIGYGKIGSQHVKNLLKGSVPACRIAAVADIDPAALENAKKALGPELPVFNTAQELIDSGLVEAVHICTPHYFHPVYAQAALKAGLHVLVEKPAGVYTKQVREMNETARSCGKVFAMMFNQRTSPVYMKVRDMVKSGELGRITHINWIVTNWFRAQSYYDQGGWRATWDGEGGGVLLNQNPHNLDMFQWIFGMPSRVKSVVYYGKHRNIEVEDDVYAVFEYTDGATALYSTTIADSPGTNRLEISGDNGKIVVEDNTIVFYRLKESISSFNARFTGGIGQPECEKIIIETEGEYTSHMGILRNFCAAILGEEKLIAPGEEGIHGLELSNAIHLSSWSGENWVSVPVDENLFYTELKKRIDKKA